MKITSILMLCAGLVLAGCAPLKVYYKEGESVARMDHDESDCQVAALARVPPNTQRRYIPPTYTTDKHCNYLGHCHYYRRILSPGRYETYDANQPLRDKVTDQCMADRGYVLTSVKLCDGETTRTASHRPTRVMPPLTSGSCAIRFRSGRWRIVTPTKGP